MSNDAIHITTLKHIERSPAHYRAALAEAPDSAGMRFGRLVHTIVLGGPPSAVWDGERRGKAWLEFKAANADREIVTKSEVEEATRVANAVLTCPAARPFLDGETERPVEWDMFGRRFATRGIDILGRDFVADLKTTNDAHPDRFIRGARRLGYDAQLAGYSEAAASIGKPVQRYALIAVETKPPYAVTVFTVGPRVIDNGMRRLRLWTERLIACEEVDEWPAYAQVPIEWNDEDGETLSLLIDGEEVAA